MTKYDKTALKVAVRLHEQLENIRRQPSAILHHKMEHMLPCLRKFQTLHRKLTVCCERGFVAAAKALKEDAAYLAQDLTGHLQMLQTLIGHKQEPLPSLHTLLNDLEQLEQEFGDWTFEARSRVLSVTIEPVMLEGIYLGPFEIQLHICELTSSEPVRSIVVEALDPHPAGSDSGVTHPHVNVGKLCAGDGAAALSNALKTGRMSDAFIMVRSVLTNYNPNSPYVRLDEWEGMPCYNCGCTTSEDNRYYCENCDRDFCGDCYGWCTDCETSMCTGCLSSCSACGESRCDSCLTSCRNCGDVMCSDCLEEGLCSNCKEEEENRDDEEHKGQPGEATSEISKAGASSLVRISTEIHPLGLG